MKPLRLALVGDNIGYSSSPEIFGAIFQTLGVEGRFELVSTPSEQLKECVGSLRKDGYSGLAVTIPHKQNIMSLLDTLDTSAEAVGAVNSIVIQSDKLTGYNTDCDGFSFALRRDGFTGCARALILGSGGAARAIVYALNRDFGLTRFVIVGRNRESVGLLVNDFRRTINGLELVGADSLSDPQVEDLEYRLVVNCTPVGGPNHEQETLFPDDFAWGKVDLYFDLNYNADSRMLSEARRAGIATMDGSAMLVAQAVKSLQLWTGLTADFESIYGVVFERR